MFSLIHRLHLDFLCHETWKILKKIGETSEARKHSLILGMFEAVLPLL